MTTKKAVAQPDVFLPPKWEVADAAALQALIRGDATEHQQQRAVNWIIYSACDTYGMDYRTEPRDHAFASGRRFVGLQLVKMLKLNTAAFREKA